MGSGDPRWVLLQTRSQDDLSPVQLPSQPPPSPPSSFLSPYTSLDNRISPSILLIIAILAVIFFLSGLLHLLIRYLLRPTARDQEETDNATVLQGQLQQLFHLHDAGVDQSFIDTLPVFFYKAIVGAKDPFDCAVCLCEFESDDKLRLLPNCSHAFHIECIDTWLLSHSTCPLCRGALLAEFSPNSGCSPVVLLQETGSESSREFDPDHVGENSHVGFVQEEESLQKTGEDVAVIAETPPETKVMAVKLGKYRNLEVGGNGEGSSSNGNNANLDGRRCFSMGSFEYVMDEKSLLQVAIRLPEKKPGTRKPRRRLAMSECDCHSQREGFKGLDTRPVEKSESFSVSKTWLRGKKDQKQGQSSSDWSRRAFSFRIHEEAKPSKHDSSRRVELSEFDSDSEFDLDVEVGSCNNARVLSRREEMPSFARRTLLWVTGRNHKVVNHI